MARRILLLDTTLADGIRADDIALAPLDQVRIALRLDGLGVGLIEVDPAGGAARFLREARRVVLKSARLLARIPFSRGRCRERDVAAARALRLGSGGVVFHGASEHAGEELSETIAAAVAKDAMAVVRFEDWFRSFAEDADAALQAVGSVVEAGAAWVLLRESSGTVLPRQVAEGIAAARRIAPGKIGVGASNDSGLAVASVLEGVGRGARLAEGVINGYGPRCGYADLVQVAANLSLRQRCEVLPENRLRLLTPTARFVAELVNHAPDRRAPFVGDAAFLGDPRNLPVDPRLLGSRSRAPLEDARGHSLLSRIARERGIDGANAQKLLTELRSLEARGFRFEGAEASFELALQRLAGLARPYFEVESYRCLSERLGGKRNVEATCVVRVGGKVEHTAASGEGPIHALDLALRKSLERFYPSLRDMRLHDYKVRLLPGGRGTAATTRVLAESGDGRDRWGTSGVSDDVLDASFLALVDAVTWKLHKDGVASPA